VRPGFSLQIFTPDDTQKKGWGGGFTLQRYSGVPGLSVSGSVQQRDGPGPATDIRVLLKFDAWRVINNTINKKKQDPRKE
jgi:hypothetical protein